MLSLLSRVTGPVVSLTLAACSSDADCLLLGDDPLGDVDRVTEFARAVDVAASEEEAAFMVGAAKGFSQIARAAVRVCLRSGADGKTEYRLVADNGEVMGWRAPTLAAPAR